jgi:hypothetical protein
MVNLNKEVLDALLDAGASEEKAQAAASVIMDRDQLATKADLQELKSEFRSELKAGIHELKSELKSELGELKTDFHAMQANFHAMQANFHAMEVNFHAMQVAMLKWYIGGTLALGAFFFAVIRLTLTTAT